MALKIETNQSATAHHIIDGPVLFPYAIDAQHAISSHPGEWSPDPWPADATATARKDAGEPEIEMTPEERAAIDDHAKAVAEANERLTKFRAEQAEKKKIADQVAADEALVASPPPRPDPNVRRPLSPAQMRKRAAETDEERMVREKRDADQQAAAFAAGAPITG
jgi:hypothetical protein